VQNVALAIESTGTVIGHNARLRLYWLVLETSVQRAHIFAAHIASGAG
jgi:hypothetical protein